MQGAERQDSQEGGNSSAVSVPKKNGLVQSSSAFSGIKFHRSAFLTLSDVQDHVCVALLCLKTGNSVPLHMVSEPEMSVCSNALSQNFLAKRELTVFVGMALFLLNNHKHYFLSCILGCFRTHLVRKFGAGPQL